LFLPTILFSKHALGLKPFILVKLETLHKPLFLDYQSARSIVCKSTHSRFEAVGAPDGWSQKKPKTDDAAASVDNLRASAKFAGSNGGAGGSLAGSGGAVGGVADTSIDHFLISQRYFILG
jgi:hypothetical protein